MVPITKNIIYEINKLSQQILDKYPNDCEEIDMSGEFLYLFFNIKPADFTIEQLFDFYKTIDYSETTINQKCKSYIDSFKNNISILKWKMDLNRFTNLKNLFISNIHIFEIINIPETVTNIIVESTSLKYISELPSGLKVLNISNNRMKKLPKLQHTNLEILNFSNNRISFIPTLPETLKSLLFSNNSVSNIPHLPTSLIYLDFNNNNIHELKELPKNIKTLNCSKNQITKLPCLSIIPFLKVLICYSNQITQLPPLPGMIDYLDYRDNPINIFVPFPISLIG
jgi:Leucine-rich repeat (LRR) protein